MSLTELQKSVSSLNREDRRRLTAYLVFLDDQEDKAYREKLAGRIDDKSVENWVTIDELDKRLGINDS